MNLDAPGAAGTPYELYVERGKIQEFARAIYAEDRRYLDDDAPTMPGTFLFTTMFWQRGAADPWPALQIDLSRALHGEQEYVFHGPLPRAGERLHCLARITEVYEKEGGRGGRMSFAVITTEFRDDFGRLRAEARMTCIETAAKDQA
jgi:hypothetical protein